ncbi:hypothetical protein [Neobacillus sp. DY30]|jgi:hypothetical protein|uniref:hypothetical protein n=1 Tax=Neobacillus sp. DY30 TaxID=3047871 RepID=UPI0024C0AACE|nr:hypothetical protein [Neobacillus sp. DY30]WHX98531.1 hypothetical protein QNH29_17980 [Neobacillus sp. DY30]
MTDRELLEGIFSELKEVRNDIDRLEKKLEVQNDILRTFKYDIDFITEKQAKQELKLNRISKQLEV